jgi:tetratricopeptide (TPR) repeat protein
MLAVFGAAESREDDPYDAVRCGLALLVEGQAVRARVHSEHGYDGFDVRVGIHTGAVLLGGGVDADGTIRGAAVNIAARMEQTAPAGALRITDATYSQVRGLFDVQVQEPIAVKGVEAPIRSYLVVRAKPRAFHIVNRGIEGVATRMVGRDAELELLQDAFSRLWSRPGMASTTIVADAGLGKSRLLTEFEAWAEARPEPFFIFRGRAQPGMQGQAYGLLRDVLAWRLQIAENDGLDVARSKVEHGIAPLFADEGDDMAQSHAQLLGHLVGIDHAHSRHVQAVQADPKHLRNRAFHAAAQIFRRLGASKDWPVVLQLEDLHWADEGSLDFLDYLAQVNQDVRMLVVATTRPTLFERRPDWGESAAHHQRIDLAPMDPRASRELALEMLQRLPEVPPSLRELVTRSSEGNPFYMEELIKMLVSEGAIETGGSHSTRWTLREERFLATAVPTTLAGVLQARLDALPAAERVALQEASVIGAMFWDRALFALDSRADEVLPSLVRRELVLRRAGQPPDEDMREYTFQHHILHQVTYGTLLKRTRRELHQKVARWLASVTGLRAGDYLGITADHYERAGDVANAAEYHTRAAEHAHGRFAHDAARTHVRRALTLIGLPAQAPSTAADRERGQRLQWRLQDITEHMCDLQGIRAEQRVAIDALTELAEQLDDDRCRAYAAFRLSGITQFVPDIVVSARAARAAMTWAEKASDTELKLHAMARLSYALQFSDRKQAEEIAQRGLAEARAKGLRRSEAKLLNVLSQVTDDELANLEMQQRTLALCRELGDHSGEVLALGNVGGQLLWLGDLPGARQHLEQSLRLARAQGDRPMECMNGVHLTCTLRWLRDDVRALALARSNAEVALATGVWSTAAFVELGEAEWALGRHAEAVQAFERARALGGSDVMHDQEPTAALARVALARGDVAAAVREIERLIGSATTPTRPVADFRDRFRWTCFQVLSAAGDPRADEWQRATRVSVQASLGAISDPAIRRRAVTHVPLFREVMGGEETAAG